MRVISGTAKGRRLASFHGDRIRPTADRIKEALFNILNSSFGSLEDRQVLDLFSGTGNLGIEALSRGAAKAVFIDENPKSVAILKKNIDICGFAGRSEIIISTVEAGIRILSRKGYRFNLVFLDPPYGKGLVTKTLNDLANDTILEEEAIVIAEHSSREVPPDEYGYLTLSDRRKYGDTGVSLYIYE